MYFTELYTDIWALPEAMSLSYLMLTLSLVAFIHLKALQFTLRDLILIMPNLTLPGQNCLYLSLTSPNLAVAECVIITRSAFL